MKTKKAPLLSFLLFLLLFLGDVNSQEDLNVPEQMRATNITMVRDKVLWSGTMFNRTIEDKKKTFVISCGHGLTAVDNIKGYRRIYKDGLSQKVVYYNCRALYFSTKEDLSVYELNVDAKPSAIFSNKDVYRLGQEIYNIGAYGYLEVDGAITKGIISKSDLQMSQFPNRSFDLSDCDLTGGFSGGGVFLKSGEYIGFNVLKINKSACAFKPIREIKRDLSAAGLNWVYDTKIDPPTLANLSKINKITIEIKQ